MGQTTEDLLLNSKDTIDTVSNLSLDTIILIILFVLFFGYGLRYGKRNVISLLLSFYIAIPIVSSFPYLEKLSFVGDIETSVIYAQIIIFVLAVILSRLVVKKVLSWELSSSGIRNFIEHGFLAASLGGLLVAISYHIIPTNTLYTFAPQIDALFTSTQMFFWWLVAPLVMLFFTVRR